MWPVHRACSKLDPPAFMELEVMRARTRKEGELTSIPPSSGQPSSPPLPARLSRQDLIYRKWKTILLTDVPHIP